MSKTIENNVVQMTFDNKDFEKNISTSSKSIEKLNEQLKFKDASKGFKDIEKYANEVNFDGLNKAISNINSVFTVTGNLTKKIIDDIAGYFERKIANAVSSVSRSINYVFDPSFGVQKYEQYTTALLAMTSNLSDYDKLHFKDNYGSELEFVEHYIETLALYADETSYSMTDMVDTMAKFAANNVNIDKSSSAMMGLANMAAVAGQNAKTATASMYQLAQAFGTGYVRYQDWVQAFTLKNIATKESKEIFLKAAMEMHTIDQDDIAAAKKALGEENWMNYFFTSDSLNEGWLKTDTVLVKGLQEYSKASDLIFERLDDIGDVSVSNILTWASAMKESGKSATDFVNSIGGAERAKIDDVDLLVDTLDRLASKEYELSLKAFQAAQNATNFHEALEATRDAVGTKMMYALKYFIGDLDQARKLWTKFANSLWDVFAAPLDNALAGLKAWNKGVEEVNEGFLKSIKFEDNYKKFWDSLGRMFTNVGLIFDGLIDQIRFLAGCFVETENGLEGTSIIAEYTLSFMKSITRTVSDLADATGRFLDSDLYANIQEIFWNIIKTVRNVKRIVGSLFDATFGTILKNIGGPLTAISEILVEISDRFSYFTYQIVNSDGFAKFTGSLTKLTTALMKLGTYLIGKFGNILLKIIDIISLIVSKIVDFLVPGLDFLMYLIEDEFIPFIDKIINGQYGLAAAIDWVAGKLDNIIPKIEDFTKKVFGMDFTEIKTKFTTFADGFIGDVKRVGKEGFDKLKEFFKGSFDKDTKGSWGALVEAVSEANSVSEGAENVIRWSADALMRPIQLVFDLAGIIVGKDLTEMSSSISKFIHSIANSFADISPNLFNFITKVGTLLLGILKFVADLVIDIVKYAAGMSTTTGFGLLDDIIYSIKTILISLVEAFSYLLKQLASLAPLITPAIKKTIDYIGDILMMVADLFKRTFKNIANIKTPEEFLGYVKTLAKIVIALVIFIKLFMLLDDIIFAANRFKMGFKTIKANIFTVTDAIAGVLDTIGGYGLPGMIRMFAILLASIGYALGQVAKVGQMINDSGTKKGIVVAFVGVIAILVIFKMLVKSLMKTSASLMEEMIAYKTKMGWGKFGNPDDNEMNRTFSGIAHMLAGLGIALIGISAAIGILAKVSQTTSANDLYSAVAGISFLLLALGLFMKLSAAQQNSSRSLTDAGYKSNKQGKYYKGVAAALIGFAVSILLMVPAIALLTHTVKSAGLDNFREAVDSIIKILGIMGLMMVLVTAASNGTGFISSLAFIGILGAISKLMVVMAALIAGLALTMAYLIKKEDREAVFKVLKYFMWAFTVVGAIIAVLSLGSQKLTWAQQIRDLGIRIAKLMFISFVLTGLAMIIGAISGSVWLLVHLMTKYKFDGKVPDVISTAIYVIIGILAALTVFVWLLIKTLKFDKGDWKAIVARVGGMFLLLLAMSNMLIIISGIATLMAWLISFKRVGDNIWKAVGIMGAILGGLTLFLFLMTGIGKIAQGAANKYGGDAAVELIKIAMAIAVVAASVGVMAGVFVALAKAVRKIDNDSLREAFEVIVKLMLAITVFSLAMGVINVVFGGVITVLAGMFKVLAYVILGVVAAVILFGKYGDKMAEWLNNARPKIEAGFRALGKAMVAVIEGFNESLPLILEALNATILIILSWIAYNIDTWIAYLVKILAIIIISLTEAMADQSTVLGQALFNLLMCVEGIVVSFLANVLGKDIEDWTDRTFEGIGSKILKYIPQLSSLVAAGDKALHDAQLIMETSHQKKLFDKRLKGAEHYMELLQKVQDAENQAIQASELTDEVAKSQAQRRAAENKNYWEDKVRELRSEAESIFAETGIDVTKGADAQELWYYSSDYVKEHMKELLDSRDWSEDFDWNNRIGAEHSSDWYASLNPHSSATTGTSSTNNDTSWYNQATKSTKSITTSLKDSLKDIIPDANNFSIMSKENGEEDAESWWDGVKSWIGDKKETVKKAFQGMFSSDSENGNGILDYFGMSQFTSVPQYNLDTAVPVTSMTEYGSQIPDIDSIYQNTDLSGGVIDSNYDTAYANEQLNGLSNTMTGNTDDVVNAINDQKQAYIDALAEYTQAIIEKTYEIKLNNDVVAGELAPSLDKALGRIQAMKQKRGV